MSSDLGSGPLLDQALDFQIANDGDLRIEEGADELGKDLSFQLIIILDDLIGQPMTPDVRSQVKSLTIDTLISDVRVLSVNESGIRVREIGRGTIQISASATTVDGDQEFVFNV